MAFRKMAVRKNITFLKPKFSVYFWDNIFKWAVFIVLMIYSQSKALSKIDKRSRKGTAGCLETLLVFDHTCCHSCWPDSSRFCKKFVKYRRTCECCPLCPVSLFIIRPVWLSCCEVLNCQKCYYFHKRHKSHGFPEWPCIAFVFWLVRSSLLITLIKCLWCHYKIVWKLLIVEWSIIYHISYL